MKSLIQKLADGRHLDQNEWVALIAGDYDDQLLFDQAVAVRQRVYGRDVYIRGLIELSNFCANDCPSVTASRRRTFSPAARPVMRWASAPSFCRAVRMAGIGMITSSP